MGVGPRCKECGGALKSVLRSVNAKNPTFVDVPSRYKCKRCGKVFPKFPKDPLWQEQKDVHISVSGQAEDRQGADGHL